MAKREKKDTGYARLKYGAEEEIWEEEEERVSPHKKKKAPLTRAGRLRRVVCILVAAMLVVALWMNRDSMWMDNIGNWLHTRLVGMGVGDGYPTAITGTQVLPTNLQSGEGMAVTLSDTSFTVQNATARQVISRQHSFSQPRMCTAGGRWLVYNLGATGYRMETVSRTELTGTADGTIQTAAVAASGRFALVTQAGDNASRLTVYMANGEKQYTYSFYDAYITAIALNRDGTRGVMAAVSTRGGALMTTLYLLDFSKEDAVAAFDAGDNLVMFLHWGDNGVVTAVGDTAALYGSAAEFTFAQFAYGSASLCAYAAGESTVCIALQGGESPETVVLGKGEPVRVALEEKAVSCSVYGGTGAVLSAGNVIAFDLSTGERLAQAAVGRDARAVALSSESTAYVLGVSDIRFCDLDGAGT